MSSIAANIAQIRQRIEAVCQRSSRDPEAVRLIAAFRATQERFVACVTIWGG